MPPEAMDTLSPIYVNIITNHYNRVNISFGYLSIEAASKPPKMQANPFPITEEINDGYKIRLILSKKENLYEKESDDQTVGDIGF